jgi:hypothetical protein
MPCSPVEARRRFGGTKCLYLQSRKVISMWKVEGVFPFFSISTSLNFIPTPQNTYFPVYVVGVTLLIDFVLQASVTVLW